MPRKSKKTQNTNLVLAMGRPEREREWLERVWRRSPGLPAIHIARSIMKHLPLQTRGCGNGRLKVKAEGRSYTVLVLADDPAQWQVEAAQELLLDRLRFYTRVCKAASAREIAGLFADPRELGRDDEIIIEVIEEPAARMAA